MVRIYMSFVIYVDFMIAGYVLGPFDLLLLLSEGDIPALLHRFVNYRVFIKYRVFSLKFCDFSELCQFCCSAGFLPAWCVYTH